jgi:hypothetical protein
LEGEFSRLLCGCDGSFQFSRPQSTP